MQVAGERQPLAVKQGNLSIVDVRMASADELCKCVIAGKEALPSVKSLLTAGVDVLEMTTEGVGLEQMRTPLMTAVLVAAETGEMEYVPAQSPPQLDFRGYL